MSTNPQPTPPTVLIIDPDPLNRDVTRTILQHAGFRILEAEEPDEGVRLAISKNPALIVTELFHRTDRGWEILERIGELPETRRIPVVAFSAYALPQDREAAVRSGATRYLAKPLPPAELEATVIDLLL
jgi:CheY-like chemotaxis protein